MSDTEDTRYKRISAAHKIVGYCIAGYSEKAFVKARFELIVNLKKDIEFIEKMTYEEFLAGRNGR